MTLGFIGAGAIPVAIVTGLSTVGPHVTVRSSPRIVTGGAVSCEILKIGVRLS